MYREWEWKRENGISWWRTRNIILKLFSSAWHTKYQKNYVKWVWVESWNFFELRKVFLCLIIFVCDEEVKSSLLVSLLLHHKLYFTSSTSLVRPLTARWSIHTTRIYLSVQNVEKFSFPAWDYKYLKFCVHKHREKFAKI